MNMLLYNINIFCFYIKLDIYIYILAENRYNKIIIMDNGNVTKLQDVCDSTSCPFYPDITLSLHNHKNMAAIL